MSEKSDKLILGTRKDGSEIVGLDAKNDPYAWWRDVATLTDDGNTVAEALEGSLREARGKAISNIELDAQIKEAREKAGLPLH